MDSGCSHRHEGSHSCPTSAAVGEKAAVAAERRGLLHTAKKVVQERINSLVKQQADRKPTAKKVQIMKMKTKATGSASIPEEKRFYLEAVYPIDSKVAPKLMFFNSGWTVGKVLDNVADAGGIENKNNQANTEKLCLISLKTGNALETSITLLDYATGGALESGDAILLERMTSNPT